MVSTPLRTTTRTARAPARGTPYASPSGTGPTAATKWPRPPIVRRASRPAARRPSCRLRRDFAAACRPAQAAAKRLARSTQIDICFPRSCENSRPFRHADPDLSRLPDQRRCSPALAPRVLALRGVSGGATAHDPRPYVWAPGGTGGDVQERGGVLLVNVCGPIREDLGAMALGHSCVTVDGAELLDRGDEPHEPRRRGRALFFSDLARECAFGCSRSMRRERLGR